MSDSTPNPNNPSKLVQDPKPTLIKPNEILPPRPVDQPLRELDESELPSATSFDESTDSNISKD